jgi:hypothetical protein
LTGLAGSGKTTIACLAHEMDLCASHLLDSDDIGHRLMTETARMMADAGLTVYCASNAASKDMRERARGSIGKERFYEVYIQTDQKECSDRSDVEVSAYDPPTHAAITLKNPDTEQDSQAQIIIQEIYQMSPRACWDSQKTYHSENSSFQVCPVIW